MGGYVLGTESESAAFAGDGIEYRPAGIQHAVDPPAPRTGDGPGPVLGYAICGTPVRIWPEHPLDPSAHDLDPQCATLIRTGSRP